MVTIKQAAEITGLTVKSLRHYEKLGLCIPALRSDAGYRLYTNSNLSQLRQIKYYRDMKFSLRDIARLLTATSEDRIAALELQASIVKQKLQEYTQAQSILESLLGNDRVEPTGSLAIVGIDLQNDILSGGALPCKRIETLLPLLSSLYSVARECGVPIIYICDCHCKGDPELNVWNDHMMKGTWGAQIMDALAPHPQDYIVEKNRFNGFVHTSLQAVLDSLNINTIIFTGWRTDVCVAQTAIEAFYRGLHVIVLEDGVNSTTEAEHRSGLRLMQINYNFDMYSCKEMESMLLSNSFPQQSEK